MKRLVICEINEEYLKNVKKQMEEQKMPLPKDDSNITIAHKPLTAVDFDIKCECKLCNSVKETL